MNLFFWRGDRISLARLLASTRVTALRDYGGAARDVSAETSSKSHQSGDRSESTLNSPWTRPACHWQSGLPDRLEQEGPAGSQRTWPTPPLFPA